MLRIVIPEKEGFDDEKSKFVKIPEVVVDLEHSLLSLSKWESKYQKPFLAGPPQAPSRTNEEAFGYLKAMVITPGLDPDVLHRCTQENVDEIQSYIDSSQSATTFGHLPERRGPGEIITSELIYYWLIAYQIPFECETWHLNRLFSLIRICNIKNSKQPKMGRRELAERNARLNAERKAKLGTRG